MAAYVDKQQTQRNAGHKARAKSWKLCHTEIMKRHDRQLQDYKWTDIHAPNSEDLKSLLQEFPIPESVIMRALDPEQLPTCEFFRDFLFMILRHHDLDAESDSATIEELSTKIVFFIGETFLLTVHRQDLEIFTSLRSKENLEKLNLIALVRTISSQAIRSFEPSLDKLDSQTDVIENRVFSLQRKSILREGYIVKRQASSYRKLFKFTRDVFFKIPTEIDIPARDLAQVREPLEKLIFYADSIHEEIAGLLGLHLSLMSQKTNEASFRTNEVMRVLTVFSIFFLPLNFIAGLYGMNFEHMPELKSENGYFYTLGMMILLVLGITLWIWRRGWLKKEEV